MLIIFFRECLGKSAISEEKLQVIAHFVYLGCPKMAKMT